MTSTARRRRDVAFAGGIGVVVLVAATALYLTSDAHSVAHRSSEAIEVTAPHSAPSSLTERWTSSAPVDFAPLVSPYGVVVTGDGHTVTGLDAATGQPRWTYGRSNLPMCALTSGDTTAARITDDSGVHGILVAYAKGDHCSEITVLDPRTGDIVSKDGIPRQRTTLTELGAVIAFGGSYAASATPDLIEMWRSDLVRTIQYGNQPTPVKPGTRHLGCAFTDIALANTHFATLEDCPDTSADSRLVINYADPGNTPIGRKKDWNTFKFLPRAEFDLGTEHARIVGITRTEVAVLVDEPAPAVVVYGTGATVPPKGTTTGAPTTGATPTGTTSTGTAEDPAEPVFTEISRAPVDVPAARITDSLDPTTPGIHPTASTISGDTRYSVFGQTLLAVRGARLADHWTMDGVLGTVSVVGSQVLAPVTGGLAVVDGGTGRLLRTIPVDRGGYTGPVDVRTSGDMVIEIRGAEVVAYS